ncbi:MAG TPA: hypothetical protein PLE76_04550 [Rectinema sp.]|nr:hypothetical protein [Rectinema sp.]
MDDLKHLLHLLLESYYNQEQISGVDVFAAMELRFGISFFGSSLFRVGNLRISILNP